MILAIVLLVLSPFIYVFIKVYATVSVAEEHAARTGKTTMQVIGDMHRAQDLEKQQRTWTKADWRAWHDAGRPDRWPPLESSEQRAQARRERREKWERDMAEKHGPNWREDLWARCEKDSQS